MSFNNSKVAAVQARHDHHRGGLPTDGSATGLGVAGESLLKSYLHAQAGKTTCRRPRASRAPPSGPLTIEQVERVHHARLVS